MYQVSDAYKLAIKEPAQQYRLRLKINNEYHYDDEVVGGSFYITNQCADNDEVQIGSVYVAELKCTIEPDVVIRGEWKGSVIVPEEGLLLPNSTWEYVPLGIFTVEEANHTEDGVQIVAYDNMLKFDKTWGISTTIGSPFNILKILCSDCSVQLGMTQAEVEAFANGTQTISLYSENDCETYRDVLFWLAQTLGTFATIGRDGKLYLREYKSSVEDNIDETMRFEGGSFSDFVTEYSGIAYTDIQTQEYKYYNDGDDTKLTYNLGSNPFIQYGTDSTKKQMCLNILNKLKVIQYTPFSSEYLSTPAYDLGDVFTHSGGIGNGAVGCVMKYEYQFSTGYKVEGFGKNPSLSTARNKVDKNIAGLMSRTDKNAIQLYTFKNADEAVINDGEEEQLIYIRFTTMEAKQVTFQAQILAESEATVDEVVARLKYYLDGALIEDYVPTETWTEDGKHIISLYYVIDVEPNTLYRWQVMLEADGGTVTVPVENARGTIWGQGLVAIGVWDGYIDCEDTIGAIPLDDIGVATMTDSMTTALIIPLEAEPSDTFGGIPLDDIGVAEFSDVVHINKTSIYYNGLSWEDLLTMDWGEVLDKHLW